MGLMSRDSNRDAVRISPYLKMLECSSDSRWEALPFIEVLIMKISRLIKTGCCLLTEGAIIERIRRSDAGSLDPVLLHALHIYDADKKRKLHELHRQYLEIGRMHNLPMLVFTDTWRANIERLKESGVENTDVNGDCVRFLQEIVAEYGKYSDKVCIGGLIGCKGDAYRPEEALSEQIAQDFHSFQIDALALAGVDFLFAATIPSAGEAAGIANAMASNGLPYAISFVLNRQGCLLDGTALNEAIYYIDRQSAPPPLFYMANCCHPTFFESAMKDIAGKNIQLLKRIIGLQANTSSRDASELDNLEHLDSEDPNRLAGLMLDLHRNFNTKILGGCCGTDDRHISAIAEGLKRGRE